MLCFSIFVSLLAAAGVRGAYHKAADCNRLFIKDGKPSSAGFDPILQNCAKDKDAPTQIGSTMTDVYHFNEARGWVYDELHQILLTAAHEALQEVIPEFSKLGVVPDLYIFFVRDRSMKSFLANTFKATEERCRIKVFWDSIETRSRDAVKQTIAHELWHCVQWQHFGRDLGIKTTTNPFHWWSEGSAEYFSNVVYPAVNDEHRLAEVYDASKSLWDQWLGYPASVFFQWVEQNPKSPQTPLAIWEWTKKFTIVNNGTGEATRVAGLPEMADWFSTFIEALADKGVPDSDGVSYVPHNGYMLHVLGDTMLSDATPTAEYDTYVAAFAGNQQITSLGAGQTVELSLATANSKVTLKYKVDFGGDDEPTWVNVPANAPATLVIPCGDRINIDLLATNIGDSDETVTVKFTRKSKDKTCCKSKDAGFFKQNAPTRKRFISGDSRFASDRTLATVEAEVDPTSGLDVPVDDDDEELPECEGDDKCLVGSWSLNLPAMAELIKSVLVIPDVPELQFSNLVLSGSSVLSISDTWVGNWTYDAFSLTFDVNVVEVGLAGPVRTTVDGDMSFNVVLKSNSTGGAVAKRQSDGTSREGEFLMDVISAAGFVVSYSGVTGEINWPMDSSYVPPDLVLRYVCTESTLALTGFLGGAAQSGWVYAFDRV